jgi:hypothetical protein
MKVLPSVHRVDQELHSVVVTAKAHQALVVTSGEVQ